MEEAWRTEKHRRFEADLKSLGTDEEFLYTWHLNLPHPSQFHCPDTMEFLAFSASPQPIRLPTPPPAEEELLKVPIEIKGTKKRKREGEEIEIPCGDEEWWSRKMKNRKFVEDFVVPESGLGSFPECPIIIE